MKYEYYFNLSNENNSGQIAVMDNSEKIFGKEVRGSPSLIHLLSVHKKKCATCYKRFNQDFPKVKKQL